MELVIIIGICAFVLFCVIMITWATISEKRSSKRSYAEHKGDYVDDFRKIMVDLKVNEQKYSCYLDPNPEPSDRQMNISILTDIVVRKLKILSSSAFNAFKQNNDISKTADTDSSIGFCAISKDSFFYNICDADTINCNFSFNRYQTAYNQYKRYKNKIDNMNSTYKCIPIDSINFYNVEGDVQYTANVSGGGNDPTAAMKGAVLAGTTGAIIGAAAGQKEIKTTTEKHDDRKLIFCYKNLSQDTIMHISSNNPDKTLAALQALLPEKYYPLVISKNSPVTVNKKIVTSPSSKIDTQKLRELSELLKDGIITQEDFDSVKKQMLNS